MLTPRLATGLLLVVLAGCGGGDGDGPNRERSRPAAAAAAERVIRDWADTLRRGDVEGAARRFALPSVVVVQVGGPEVRLRTRGEAESFNASLPCGAVLARTVRAGRYVNATFRLVERAGAHCDGPGATARTAFLVRGGRIVEWRRLPDAPGEDGPAPAPRPGPSEPEPPEPSAPPAEVV